MAAIPLAFTSIDPYIAHNALGDVMYSALPIPASPPPRPVPPVTRRQGNVSTTAPPIAATSYGSSTRRPAKTRGAHNPLRQR